MPAKKRAPGSTPLPKQSTKSPSNFVNKYGFKISPLSAASAVAILRDYVAERAAILDPDHKGIKISEAADAIRMMDALYKFKEEFQDTIKSPVEKAYDSLRFSVIPNLMDDEGLTTVGVEGVGRTSLQDDVQCKVVDADELKSWLIAEDKEDMIKETVNAQTLAAFVRARLKAVAALKGKTSEEVDEHMKKLLPSTEVLTVKPIVRAVITRG